MLVDIHHNGKLEAAGVELAQAIPIDSDVEAYREAVFDLVTKDEHHCGGGAAPHFILKLHRAVDL